MNISNKRESFTLFFGDIFILILSLWLTLLVRNASVPTRGLFYAHLLPFTLIFAVSLIIFFIAGMYEKHTIILKSRLPVIIFRTEIINSSIAVIFFYLIPFFGIAPKITLFLYVVISFALIDFWRLYLYHFFVLNKREQALLIGAGREMGELINEINRNGNYGLQFVEAINLDDRNPDQVEDEIKRIYNKKDISIIVIDLEHDIIRPILPSLYKLIFSQVRFVAMYKVYEDIFQRIPFSILQYNWFLENISISPKPLYDSFKEIVDFILSLIGGIISLIFYPFVWLAIKLDDGGPIFVIQERIGQRGRKINLIKFRSMKSSDGGVWVIEKDDRITRVGKFLRKTRIDELPQFWNVLRGDVSLIGPRPDIHDIGLQLEKEIPYYSVRNIIKPGLSGWAQIKMDLAPVSVGDTKIRLAYDLFYVKNRSFIMDIQIILKTIRTLLSRTGR